MKKRKLLLMVINRMLLFSMMILLIFSCVPNRKIAYLQYGSELNAPDNLPVDSVMRSYTTGAFQYRLQPDDLLDIKISSTTPEEYNPFSLADRYISLGGSAGAGAGQSLVTGYRVDPGGYLNLPVVGRIHAGGLTVFQLQDSINRLVGNELENPVTKVNLINFRFSVIGEVNTEGMMSTTDQTLTLLQAMAMAGGVSEFGDLSRVKVIRKYNDETLVFYVNLLEESFLASNFYYVQPNDVIVVSPMKNRLLVKNVPQTLGVIATTLSLLLTVLTLISVNSAG